MESNSRSMFMNSVRFGLITSAMVIAVSLIMYIADLPPKHPVAYLSVVALLVGMAWGTIIYRNNVLGGYISYGQAFLSGLVIVIIASVIASIYNYVFYTFFDPAAMTKIMEEALEQSREKMASKGMSDEQMETALNMTRKFTSPGAIAIMGVLMNILMGGVIMLIAAIFIKKEDNSFEGQTKTEN